MKPRTVLWIDLVTAFVAGAFLYTLLFPQARAAEPWDRGDAALGAAALTATLIDWGQTRYIAKNPCPHAGGGTDCTDPYREGGFARHFIGEHPTVGKVDRYFAIATVAGGLAAHFMPSACRKWFLGGIAVLELTVVNGNKRIGLKLEI